MLAYIKGTLMGKTHESVFIETGGIGYEIGMTAVNISKLPEVNEQLLVYTYLQVREDAFALFGFLSLEEKSLFLRLISVSGIGPKAALSALSLYTPQVLISYIAAQDIAALSRIPGVGKKTASRIVLELKGSLDKDLLSAAAGASNTGSAAAQAAREALLSMGFTFEESDLALKGAPEVFAETALLQYALKRLGQ